jgi:serine/threonine-protein kinase RsbT
MRSNVIEIVISILSDADIITARQESRQLAIQLGLRTTDQTLIVTAVSEVARNILQYAKRGEINLTLIQEGGKQGLMVVAEDQGPGIPNIQQAMQDGYSTGNSLGLGLSGAKRLMDEFEISSEVGKGTVIKMKKWSSA